jgi:hypothetical protein
MPDVSNRSRKSSFLHFYICNAIVTLPLDNAAFWCISRPTSATQPLLVEWYKEEIQNKGGCDQAVGAFGGDVFGRGSRGNSSPSVLSVGYGITTASSVVRGPLRRYRLAPRV